jgi:hypothetical protein
MSDLHVKGYRGKVQGSGFADRAEDSKFKVPAFASKASVFVKTSPGQIVAESWFWICPIVFSDLFGI